MANFNFNNVIIGGRLTADPELKTTPNGTMVTTINVAVNRKGKDAKADFFQVTAWKQTAEFICKYFKKGSCICVTGSLANRQWTDTNGNKRYATDIIANEVTFVDGKGDSDQTDVPTPAIEEPKWEDLSEDEELPF